MKILHLTLKKKWFDMIASGEKKEEYREMKPYWWNRLMNYKTLNYNKFDIVEFRNGYSKNAPKITAKIEKITTGKAKPEWSDNFQGDVFIIKLGEIINKF